MHPHTYSVIPNNEDYDIVKGKKTIDTSNIACLVVVVTTELTLNQNNPVQYTNTWIISFLIGGYRIATGLKRRLQGLKVMISVGGEGTDRLFSEMVQEPVRRSMFIESAVNFMRDHDFDGLDLHWVYPGMPI